MSAHRWTEHLEWLWERLEGQMWDVMATFAEQIENRLWQERVVAHPPETIWSKTTRGFSMLFTVGQLRNLAGTSLVLREPIPGESGLEWKAWRWGGDDILSWTILTHRWTLKDLRRKLDELGTHFEVLSWRSKSIIEEFATSFDFGKEITGPKAWMPRRPLAPPKKRWKP